MAGRPCSICKSAANIRVAAEMIAAGASDQAIADRLGVGRTSVLRHRHAHVVAPAKALAEAAGKGRDAIEQRAQVLAAAEAGDPSAFVALAGIVADLRRVHERLERTAAAAEQDNQRLAVASLSAQQLRASEVRAKIGGVGGYAPPKSPAQGEGAQFVLNINFGDGRREQITATAIEGDVVPALPSGAPMPIDRLSFQLEPCLDAGAADIPEPVPDAESAPTSNRVPGLGPRALSAFYNDAVPLHGVGGDPRRRE
jgi:hypothetical protein